MSYTLQWRAKDWEAAIVPALNAGVFAAAQAAADFAKASMGSSPSPPGGPPGVDTGHLRRSITAVHPDALGTPLRSAFGTDVPYGRHLEFGAFITAKRSKYLFIPVNRALAQRLNRIGAGGGARAMPGLKFIPPGRKNRKPGYGGRFVLASSQRVHVRGAKGKSRTFSKGATVAVLKDSVIVQPRPWAIRAAIQSRDEQKAAFVLAASTVMKAARLTT